MEFKIAVALFFKCLCFRLNIFDRAFLFVWFFLTSYNDNQK